RTLLWLSSCGLGGDASWGTAPRSRPARAAAYGGTRSTRRCAPQTCRSRGRSGRRGRTSPQSLPTCSPPSRREGFRPEVAILDKGYDVTPVYDACEHHDCRPIIPFCNVKTHTPPGP